MSGKKDGYLWVHIGKEHSVVRKLENIKQFIFHI